MARMDEEKTATPRTNSRNVNYNNTYNSSPDHSFKNPDVNLTSTTSRDLEHGSITELTRKFSIWSMLALACSVLGTWSTFAQDFASGLTNGGPISILWGLALVTACNICVAVSLGELCSAMPTALGQAYWVHRLLDQKITKAGGGSTSVYWSRFVSYLTAWTNTFGWWTLTASQVGFMTNFILGIKVMFENEWAGASTGWVEFLVYLGVTLLFTLFNVLACRRDAVLPWFNNFVGICFGSLFLLFSLALLISVGIKPHLHYQPASFTFGAWINQTSWPDGVVWFTGLVQAAFGLTAFDAVLHMVEELPSPRVNAPRVTWLAVVCGAASGFLFMVVCLFCIQDLDLVLNSPTGLPFAELVQQTLGLDTAAALLGLFIFNGMGQGVSIATTASRLTWGFARDGGLPFSRYFAHLDSYWRVPARALWLQGFLIALIGVLFLFASTVLTAILSVSTIALTISYAAPIATLLFVGRENLPPGGVFSLGPTVGPVCNWVSIVYCAITTVFFFFPGSPDPKPGDMNWAIAVYGVMLVVAVGFWFVVGKDTYLKTDDAELRMEEARRREIETGMK